MKKLLLFVVCLFTIITSAISQPIVFDWAQGMGGKGNYEGSVGMAKDGAGNIYITGEFSGTRDFGSYSLTSLGFSDVFVAKYSPSGTCQWAIRGGSAFSSAYAGKLAVSGNSVYVTGNFANIMDFNGIALSSGGSKDIFIAELDASNGNCIWLEKAGSSFDDISYGLELATGGGFYICGTFTGTATFGTQSVSSSSLIDFDIFYAKYTFGGACMWVKRIGSTGTDKAFAIKELPSSQIILTGSYEGTVNFGTGANFTSAGFSDFFLAIFDNAGNFNGAFTGGGDNNDVGYGLGFDAAGNIYASGFIADTATFGTVLVNNPGNINVFIAKFPSINVCSWVKIGGNINDDIAFDMVTDAGGSSYVTGYVNGPGYFNTTLLSGISAHDAFIAKYDNNGNVRWITKIGGVSFDRGKSIMLDVAGFCYVAGDFADAATIGTTTLTTTGGATGIFLAHLGGGTVNVEELENSPFTVYPNPAHDYIKLNFSNITDEAFTLSLVTIDGKVVASRMLSDKDAVAGYTLDLSNVAAGNYTVRLETSRGDFTRTLVIGK